ncbi:hypothetical protein Ct61P_05392 [Colletotrichum tofieldiae]|nr:hypothetical protein Ct61P_05392 [Colletotrichum tofieldiae]
MLFLAVCVECKFYRENSGDVVSFGTGIGVGRPEWKIGSPLWCRSDPNINRHNADKCDGMWHVDSRESFAGCSRIIDPSPRENIALVIPKALTLAAQLYMFA